MLADVLAFEPLAVERPWGGRRLERFGRSVPPSTRVGESWEIADLIEGSEERCTPVVGGPHAGATLSELIDRHGAELLGSAGPTPDGRFPLLVKMLDARQHLSVQVHPPAAVAAADPSIRAKNESWYVLAAEPGSKMWFDIRADVDDEQVDAAVGHQTIVGLLGTVPARVGDFHHIPAGRVHALGAGVLVLEIQTPSDTTFRIYDWNVEYDRAERTLHPEEARASIVRGDQSAISAAVSDVPGVRSLVTTPDYWIKEHRSDGGPVRLDERRELRVVTVVGGEVTVGGETIRTGASRMFPASSSLLGSLAATSGSVVIETGIA